MIKDQEKKEMVDPFVKEGEWSNRKMIYYVFIPLIIVSLCSLAAFFMAMMALENSKLHPDCACRRILKENKTTNRDTFIVN